MSSLLNVHEYCIKYNESSKIKDKKDILKQIPTVLDVPKVVQQLDASSLLELNTSKPKDLGSNFCSWSDLVKCLIGIEKNKRISYKKELPDALKIVIKTADQKGPKLFRCVNDFFKHICETLEDDELYKSFSTDYSQILLDLISTPAYCHLLRPKTFESLLIIYCDHLLHMDRGSSVDVAYDPNLNARVLSSLVSYCPFDLSPVFQKLMKFFGDFCVRYPSGTKITTHLFSAINHLLTCCGPNVGRSALSHIYPPLHKFCLNNSTTTQLQLKEQIFMFWRILFRLDVDFAGIVYQPNVIIPKDSLPPITDVLLKELNSLHTQGSHLTSRKPLSRIAREEATLHLDTKAKLLLELVCYVFLRFNAVHTLQRSTSNTALPSPARPTSLSATDSDAIRSESGPSPEPATKKRRIALTTRSIESGEFGDLWELVLSEICPDKVNAPSIHTYTQLLWVLVTQHYNEIPRDVETDIIAAVVGALERMKDRVDTEVWLLRVLEEFAAHTSPLVYPSLSSVWSGAWSLAIRRVYASHPITERALQLLRAILRAFARAHAPCPFSMREVWKAPVFEEENNAQAHHMNTLRAALELLVDAAGMVKAEDRDRILKWVLDVTETLSRSEYSSLTSGGGRGHHSQPPLTVTVAHALVLLACCAPQRTQILSYDSQEDALKETREEDLTDLKTFRPLFEDSGNNTTSTEFLHVSNSQLPQSTLTRLQRQCVTRLQAISSKLISDCQEIAASKKKTLGINKSHLCGNIADIVYFLQVLSHIELISTPPPLPQPAQPSTPLKSKSSSPTSQNGNIASSSAKYHIKDDINAMQQALLQTVAEQFSHACKAADAKLLASLFSRTDALLHLLRSHTYHVPVLAISTALFAYLKETTGLTTGVNSSQVSSPMKKPKKKSTNSESDAFDLVDDSNDIGAGGTSQVDLPALVIRALVHVAPCQSEDVIALNTCGIGTVEEKLGSILEHTDSTSVAMEISEGMMLEGEKVVRHHTLLLRKALGMVQDPLCASDTPVRKHILRCVQQCAAALIKKRHACDQEAHDSIQRVMAFFSQLWFAKKLHYMTRVQVLECLNTLLPLDGLVDFDPLSELLLGSLSDADIRVRMAAVPAVLVFFSLFEDEERIFSDINKRLSDNKKTEEQIATILAVLVAVTQATTRANPEPILHELCVIAASSTSAFPSIRVLVKQAASRISKALCEPSSRHMFVSYLSVLLSSWLGGSTPRVLTDFPYYLLECDSFKQFLQTYGSYVVSQIVLMQDEAALRAIAGTLDTTPQELLQTNFTRVFASCFPLYYSGPANISAAEICETFLQRFIAEGFVNTLIPKSFDDILSTLLLETISFAAKPSPPRYAPAPIQQILEHLAKGWNTALHDLLYRGRHNDRVQQITLKINLALANAPTQRGARMRLLDSFAFFVGLLADRLVRAPILRDTILTLLRVLHMSSPATLTTPVPAVVATSTPQTSPTSSFILSAPATQPTTPGTDWDLINRACDILLGVCKKALTSKEGILELSRQVNPIVTTLIPLAQSTNVKNVIELLISDDGEKSSSKEASKQLNEAIQRLDPLPEAVGTALRAAHELRRGAGADLTPADELARLSSLPTPSNPTALLSRLNNVNATLTELRAKKHRDAKKKVPETVDNVNWAKLVQQLVEVCKKGDADASVVVLATQCLGAIPIEHAHTELPTHLQNGSQSTATHTTILEMLNSYLADYDMAVVCEASTCLRTILHTTAGATALEALKSSSSSDSEGTVEYLAPFTSKKPPKAASQTSAAPTSADILTNDAMWVPAAPLPSSSAPNTPTSLPAQPFSSPASSVHVSPATSPQASSSAVPASPNASTSTTTPTFAALTTTQNHSSWICKLAAALATSPYVKDDLLRLIGGVCGVRADFAEFIFPHLIFDALLNDTDKHARVCKGLLRYFSQLLTLSSKGSIPRESSLLTLHTLNFLRKHAVLKAGAVLPPAAQRFWHAHFWEDIDYMLVARAALRVGAHCTALLYMELWYESSYGQVTLLPPEGDDDDDSDYKTTKKRTSSRTQKRSTSGKGKLPTPTVDGQRESRELLLDIFTSIGEPDSFYGLTATFDSIAPQLAMYVHEQNWPKALGTYDMVLQHALPQTTPLLPQAPTTPLSSSIGMSPGHGASSLRISHQYGSNAANFVFHEGLMTSLQNMGHYHILDFYLKGFQKQYPNVEDSLAEYKAQAAWRASVWDTPTPTTMGFHSSVHQSLRALSSGDFTAFKDALDCARLDTVRSLSIESTMMNISPTLSNLHFLAEIDHAWDAKWANAPWHPRSAVQAGSARNANFAETEPLYALRMVLAQLLGRSGELPVLFGELSASARKARRFQIASHAVYQLKSLASPSLVPSGQTSFSKQMAEAKLEEAKVLWGQGEGTKGLSIIRHLLKAYKTSDLLRAEALLYTGKWLAHTRAERSNVVEEHLVQAIEQYTQCEGGEGDGVGKAHFTLAHFTDSLYQGVLAKAASSEWAATQELRQHKERELALCEKALTHAQSSGMSSAEKKTHLQELTRHTLVLRRVVEGDRQDSQRLSDDRNAFLTSALTHYIDALRLSDRYDVRAMFRVCSLWFNNSAVNAVNTLMREKGASLPTHKFLPLIYQITSRVSASPAQSGFQSGLCAIIESVATSHPHHVLYQLFALKNGEIEHGGTQKGAKKKEFVVEEDKVRAAKALLARLQRGTHAKLLQELATLISAYVDLTFVEHTTPAQKKPRGGTSFSMPDVMTRLTTLSNVVVPTLPAESHVKVAGFSPNYTLCGGRSAPKIVECIGDDGKKYKQLVKGKDDLRQDAVMQQTFAMVNTILREASTTSQRHLHIRTYKVVPLTHCAGLLEWVSNTTPLGGYLVGPQGHPHEGAHFRYRPNDKLSTDVAMSNAKEDDKLARFTEGMNNFKPVFHHFFLEQFHDPAEWYAKRMNYTHSVASNSIVGYVVGLGDRHAHNILIDYGSAELVHIDLGVAFEQGKMLRVPELVPFRLTRDIEDGMGITGVEGVFRRCCEETMKVLRARQSDLVTILEVFIHDPLYRWALDPLKALRLQRDDTDVDAEIGEDAETNSVAANRGNKDAERALLRLKQKLQGIEYGETLSVEGQVHTLINEARDPERLSKMYPGWAAWV